MNELDEIAIVRGNLDEVRRNLLLISQITREVQAHPWRVLRNRQLIRQEQELLRDNWQVLEVNERLLPGPGAGGRVRA